MTDRVKGLVVTLDNDYREDDVQIVINAIKMIKGVSDVQVSVANYEDLMNRIRIKNEIKDKLWKTLECS